MIKMYVYKNIFVGLHVDIHIYSNARSIKQKHNPTLHKCIGIKFIIISSLTQIIK